jgi:hypothetical protein
MTGRPHPEVHLQFGKCDGTVGRSNLHCWKTGHGSVLAGWLYELDSIAVSVLFAQAGRWEHRTDHGIRALTQAPNAFRSRTLGICAA